MRLPIRPSTLAASAPQVASRICAADHSARPDLGQRELQFLRVFARMISDKLEHDA